MKQKSDACDVFKIFKTFVERQNGCQIIILGIDSSQEYLVCDDFLKKMGYKISVDY